MSLSLRARTSWLFVATVFTAGLSLTAVVYLYLRLTPVPVQAVIEGAGEAPESMVRSSTALYLSRTRCST